MKRMTDEDAKEAVTKEAARYFTRLQREACDAMIAVLDREAEKVDGWPDAEMCAGWLMEERDRLYPL